jgi:molybdate transport system substrate-binding protein
VKQLENDAPADIVFSANSDWMNNAVANKLVDPATRIDLLSSTLVLIAPVDDASPVTTAPGFPLATMLAGRRLAMCDPMMPVGSDQRRALLHAADAGTGNPVRHRQHWIEAGDHLPPKNS